MGRSTHIPRVFVDTPLAPGATLMLGDAKRHHLAVVLRVATDAPLVVFNGSGREYAARVADASRNKMTLTIGEAYAPARESPLDVTLVQAIARGDRMDFALAKAVELGVNRIQPVFSARGQIKLHGARLEKKQAHWQRIAESAAEQSGRLICPPVAPARPLSTVIHASATDDTLRLMLAPEAVSGLSALAPTSRASLLVGPESGLSANEVEHAVATGWQALALGPRILRTETAGMAALAALQTAWGDLAV